MKFDSDVTIVMHSFYLNSGATNAPAAVLAMLLLSVRLVLSQAGQRARAPGTGAPLKQGYRASFPCALFSFDRLGSVRLVRRSPMSGGRWDAAGGVHRPGKQQLCGEGERRGAFNAALGRSPSSMQHPLRCAFVRPALRCVCLLSSAFTNSERPPR